jgi:nucleoside-diphosphate-sugar epimerase
MNVLIIGASGFIGKNLLLKLPKSWNIYGTFNTSENFYQFLELNNLQNVIPIKCNLLRPNEIKNSISTIKDLDVCIYLAANTNVREMVEEPTIDANTNIVSLLNFLQFFRARKLIYFSSGAVYMGLNGKVTPSMKINPTIPYSISKYTCEQYIKFYKIKKKFFNDYVILRFFGAYGPFEPNRKISTKLIETINGKKNDFTIYGDGKNYIDFMYIDDAIKGIMSVIYSDKANLIADFCSGAPLTLNELVKKVSEIFKKKIKIIHVGDSPEYITFYASPLRMKQLFGFYPQISLEKGFKKFDKWIKNSINK